MTNTKAEISDWKAFARNPTASKNIPANNSPSHRVRSSTIFKETFVEKIINEEGKVPSKTRRTEYTSICGVGMTKHDYDQAKTKDNGLTIKLARRRELAHGQGPAAWQTATRNFFNANKMESEAITSRPVLNDRTAAYSAAPCMSSQERRRRTINKSKSQPASDDSYPARWQLPPCSNSCPVPSGRRSGILPPHLRSRRTTPPLLPPSSSSHQGSRSNATVPPHLRNGHALT